MKRGPFDQAQGRPTTQTAADMFGTVTTVGLALPGVEATTKHDGSPRPAVIRAVLVFLGLAGAGAK